MATRTTTAQLIREDRRNLIEALVPGQLSSVAFREYDREGGLRAWAEANPKACLRRFQITDLATYEPLEVGYFYADEVETEFEVLVAYPADSRYGDDDTNGLSDAIRADRIAIEAAIGARGLANYPAGLDLFQLTETEIDRDDDEVYFLVSTYAVKFKRDIDGYIIRMTEDHIARLTEAGATRVPE